MTFVRAPGHTLVLTVARAYDEIDDHLRDWIARQPMFFVGTRPARGATATSTSRRRARSARCGCSTTTPVAYLDYVGSGAETIAHLRENGRIVVMFCAFEGPPRIVRLHGRGEYVLTGDPRFDELLAAAGFEEPTIARGAARDRRSSTSPASPTPAATACR